MGSSHLSRDVIEKQTFLEFGSDRLDRLCRAVGLEEESAPLLATFQRLSRPWNQWPIGAWPRWYPSILSDDHAPFEIAAAFSEIGPELQFYFEAQAEKPSLRSNMNMGLSILHELAATYGLSLDRWSGLHDLFFPNDPQGLFTILFGVTWAPGRQPRFKVYLNPQVRGPQEIGPLMNEAMARLGFKEAWAAACAACGPRPTRLDLPMYLCLDMATDKQARVKVYRRHYQATIEQLEHFASVGGDYHPGEARRFYGLVGGHEGPFLAKPPITSLTFREGDVARPGSVTLEFPISSYVDHDQTANERIKRCFSAYGLDAAAYQAAIDAVAVRPLDQGNGIHAHITLRRVHDAPRLTVYFATEAYVVEPAPCSSTRMLAA